MHARKLEDLGGVEPAACRDHLLRAAQDVRQRIEPRAVRHRRGMHDAVVHSDPVDVGEVAERHREQVAVRDHHALGLPGRAARVEQPSQVVGRRFGDRRAVIAGAEPAILLAPGDNDPLCGRARAREVRRHEADARARVVEDVFGFLRMELRVDGYHREPRPPRRPEDLDVLGRVRHQQPDAVAGLEAKRRAQRRRHRRTMPRERAVVGQHTLAGSDGRPVGGDPGRAGEELGEVHYLARKSRIALSACVIWNSPS